MAWKFFTKDGAEKRVPASVVNPQATLYHNAAQSLTTGTQTTLSLNTVVTDTASMTAVANKITITKAGRYLLEGAAEFAANATGQRQLFFTINGNSSPTAQEVNAAAAGVTQLNVSAAYDFNAGDTVSLTAQQTSGGALNVDAATALAMFPCSLSVTKIDGSVVNYVGVPGSLIGQEVAIVAGTGNASITALTSGTAQTVVTFPSFTADGVAAYEVQLNPTLVRAGNGTTDITTELWDNGAKIGNGRVGYASPSAGYGSGPMRYRFVPSAGAHVITARAFVGTSAGQWTDGGAGDLVTTHRIVRAA